MSTASVAPETLPSFAEVVENVRNEHPDGLDQLYRIFRMLSGSLRRQIGFQEFDDRMHDVFLLVVEAIREGKLREPAALPSYIHGVARLSTCSTIGVRARHQRLSGSLRHWTQERHGGHTPEEELAQKQRLQIMRNLLATLSDREREVLTRFYLYEQGKDQICREMSLTETQFRLTKSRAKQRLGRIGAEHLGRESAPVEAVQAPAATIAAPPRMAAARVTTFSRVAAA
jgi:RNA polymerase sigma-70 factor (ECF subfamily)